MAFEKFALSFFLLLMQCVAAFSGERIIIQSTTSTANSGLLSHILPKFEAATGIEAHVVAVGTGQALKNAAMGDGDILLVHSKAAEESFVAEGWGVKRFDVMYNDFVLVGPDTDPAQIKGEKDASAALMQIMAQGAVFISRGDNSGTHMAERSLWSEFGQNPSEFEGSWYREIGSGMGATLNMAAAVDAYTLSDRATWLSFGNKQNLTVLLEGDPRLFNQYGVIAVNPTLHPHVNKEGAEAFIEWITGPSGQAEIGAFQVNSQQLFFPNAGN
ncbi:MAG: substrate-binding domain-containing protein [Proteobacteria bacterium]|nr:substrate-binding domain-containing protein [Pseudomonadota bacterium]MDA0852387.1 substrate-binding domain-containing protein [Pseudomonadota bacterium]MDA1293628.1 substrate-binding domain-containing protein [Pseudomonadota bacterium]